MTHKVLIVDDDPDMVFITRTFLSKEGYEVAHADDGVQGLQRILEEAPDVVVLDVMMPGIDGFEVCERIKQGERGASLPIIMLSAKTGEADIERGFACGADEYITKPFDPAQLLESISRLTRQSMGVERVWQTTDPLAVKDAEIRRFVKDHLRSLAQWTILDHFIKNPDARLTEQELAAWYSGAPGNHVVKDAQALAESGVLDFDPDTGTYALSGDPELRDLMRRFFDYCTAMDARLRIICMILEGSAEE